MRKLKRKPKPLPLWAAVTPEGEYVGLYRTRQQAYKAVYWSYGIYLPAAVIPVEVRPARKKAA